MAGLRQEKLTIPLGIGIRTDVDPKLLPIGNVVELENTLWQQTGENVKRPGNSALGANYVTTLTSGVMPIPWQLATHKGGLVSLSKAGPRAIGAYSPALNKWVPPTLSAADAENGVSSKLRGALLPRRSPVYRSNSHGSLSADVTSTDIATNGTYAVVGWALNDNVAFASTVMASVIELATGRTLYSFSTSAAFGDCSVRVVFAVDRFIMVWTDGFNIKVTTWLLSSLSAGSGTAATPITIATDSSYAAFDMIASGTDALIVYFANTQTHMIRRTPSGSTTVQILDGSSASIPGGTALAWVSDLSASGKLALAVSSASQGVRVHWDISVLGVTTTTYTINGSAATATAIVGYTISAAATGEFVVVYSYGNSATNAMIIGRRTVAGGVWWQNWYLNDFGSGVSVVASKPFIQGTDVYIVLEYVSATQGTYFAVRVPLATATPIGTIDMNRTPSARFCTGQAAMPSASRTPPSVIALTSGTVLTSLMVATRFVPVGSTQTFDKGVDAVTMVFNPGTGRSVEFADSLFVAAGGVLGAFDGRIFAEDGFHLAPEPAALTQQVSGSLTLLGTYEYIWVWRYTDAYGRIRRSAPSEAVEATLTGSNRGVQVRGKTYKHHGRPGQVVAELYRNTNGQNDRHVMIAVLENDETADTMLFTDTLADTAIALATELYTDGEVLETQPPPGALAVATYKDRIALISAEDPTLIWVSLPLVETEGPRWNSESTIRIDDAHGDLVTLAAIDDRLIAFKAAALTAQTDSPSIYTITGDGPDELGNGSFGVATLVGVGVGCAEPRAVVQTPEGVLFWSTSTKQRICQVNRGLAVDYAGRDVDIYNSLTVVDAVNVPGKNLTEFFTAEGRSLVYDSTLKLWTTYTGKAAAAACAWGGRTVYQDAAQTDMLILAEDTTGTVWSDAGSVDPYDMVLTTPWLSLAQLKGYARALRWQGVGVTVGRHLLVVSLYADFDTTTPVSTFSREMASTDDWNAWELKFPSKRSAFRVKIRLTTPGETSPSGAAKVSALALLYGTKKGLRKVDYANRLT